MDNVGPGWLDYGTLGLLAIVLVGVGYAIGIYLKETFKQMKEQSAFVRKLAEQSMAAQKEHMESWKQMTRDTLAMFAKFADEINGLREDLESKTKCLREDHRDIKENVRGLVKEKL